MPNEFEGLEFVDTDPETILNEMIEEYEQLSNRTLSEADPMMIVIRWCASLFVQAYVKLNYVGNMNIPRYSKGKYLEALAELFKETKRDDAQSAVTTLKFKLKSQQSSDFVINKGVRVLAGEDLIFSTAKTLIIPKGETEGEIEAECQTAGTVGNGLAPGTITELLDDIPALESVQNITETSGGCEAESDNELYEKMRNSTETYSTAGTAPSYKYFSKEASSAISDVSVIFSEDDDTVEVRVLCENGQTPSETIISQVYENLQKEDIHVLGDKVVVSAPEQVPLNISIKYYVSKEDVASATVISENVKAAVQEYIEWQTSKIGRDINPSKLHQLIMSAGVKRVEISEPEFKKVDEISVAVLQNSLIENGGIES